MALTVYRIRDSIDGVPVEDPKVALRRPTGAHDHPPVGEWDFDPRLFVGIVNLMRPE